MKNYYEILEVNKRASKEIIEKAYKVLVKKYHPDIQSGKSKTFYENKMKELNEAYDVLSNDFLREQYDKELEEQKTASPKKREEKVEVQENAEKTYKPGTFSAIVELVKQIYQNRKMIEDLKEPTKKGVFAIILTIIIVIALGVILWFIPATNGWMRELTVENPIISWIWK